MTDPTPAVIAGSLVSLRLADGEPERYLVADELRTDEESDIQRCTPNSPLGTAIAGAKAGDRLSFRAPTGKAVTVEVIGIERKWGTWAPRPVEPVRSRPRVVATTTSDLPRLTAEQQEVVDRIESGAGHFFVTGRAGTGKSTILRRLVERSDGAVPVVAPTGVGAVNVGGVTIHSFFQLPLGVIADMPLEPHRRAAVLRAADAVIIDEVSMVSADIIDAIDRRLREVRGRSNSPFGGARLIMFGDPYQLPPVPADDPAAAAYLADHYRSHWFFDAMVWEQSPIAVLELTQIHRQRDGEFRDLLNAVRYKTVTAPQAAKLNAAGDRTAPKDTITLATTNATVDRINSASLASLPGRSETRAATVQGDFPERAYPTDFELHLKVGARVMLVKNDSPAKRWVNGDLGTVEEIRDGTVRVAIDSGYSQDVERDTWERYRYEYSPATRKLKREVVGTFTQFPLRLAWAVTIHKSQGKTYDRAVIDLGSGAFAAGQTYVALSRLTSLEGLYLTRNLRPPDVKVDPRVAEFMPETPARI